MNSIDYITGEVDYEYINKTILDGNVMNLSLIISKRNYGAIYADDTSCQGYYIIKIYISPYTLQGDLNIYGRVIYSGEIVRDGSYFFQ